MGFVLRHGWEGLEAFKVFLEMVRNLEVFLKNEDYKISSVLCTFSNLTVAKRKSCSQMV